MRYSQLNSGASFIDIRGAELKSDFTAVSLFSGAGGLDIGLEQSNIQTLACVEIDEHCRATLRHNRPEWKLFESKWIDSLGVRRVPGDVRFIDSEEILEFVGKKQGEVSFVVGGAPCQPFSNIGKRKGINDEKNGDLFQEFVRIVKGIKPSAFIFENVSGIVQKRHSQVLDYMEESFAGEGYGMSSLVLNAADYGVPQKRERFFLIGIKGVEKPSFPLPTHTKNLETWNQFIQGLDSGPSYQPEPWVTVRDAFRKIPKDILKRHDYAVMNISETVKKRMRIINQGQNFKALPMDMRPDCWKSGKHQGGDTFGRLVENEPSVTIRTAAYNPSKGRYIHPYENRGLHTLELAALQDFPSDWEFKTKGKERVTLVSGGRQIGNAVPPGLARSISLAMGMQLEMRSGTIYEEFGQMLGQRHIRS